MCDFTVVLRKKFLNKKKITLREFMKINKKDFKKLHLFLLEDKLYSLGGQWYRCGFISIL